MEVDTKRAKNLHSVVFSFLVWEQSKKEISYQ